MKPPIHRVESNPWLRVGRAAAVVAGVVLGYAQTTAIAQLPYLTPAQNAQLATLEQQRLAAHAAGNTALELRLLRFKAELFGDRDSVRQICEVAGSSSPQCFAARSLPPSGPAQVIPPERIARMNEEARQEAAQKEAARQDAIRQEAARREAAKKGAEVARQDAARQQAAIAREDAVRQEATRQNAARQDAARQDAANMEALAARQRAARREAQQSESARLDAMVQQEKARQEKADQDRGR